MIVQSNRQLAGAIALVVVLATTWLGTGHGIPFRSPSVAKLAADDIRDDKFMSLKHVKVEDCRKTGGSLELWEYWTCVVTNRSTGESASIRFNRYDKHTVMMEPNDYGRVPWDGTVRDFG